MPTSLSYAQAYKLYARTITEREAREKLSRFGLNSAIAFNKGHFYVIALDYQQTQLGKHGYLECTVANFVSDDMTLGEVVPSHAICLMHDGNRWEWE